MHIVLTGAGGQLASDLAAAFRAAGHVVAPYTREELNVTDAVAVSAVLDEVKPDTILNAAAYNRVDDAEKETAHAFAVNAYGPRVLAQLAAGRDIAPVHYSTDYVVDGTKRAPYVEADATLPLSAYAASKLAGEHFVRALATRHYVVRVCGLFGLAGRQSRHGNFVETMLRAAANGRALRVVTDQIVAPTGARDVAAATLALLEKDAPYGLYHCTAEGATSWYGYACAIFELAGVEADLSPISAAEYGASARRPPYSILDSSKLVAAGITRPRHWRDALAAYLEGRQRLERSTGNASQCQSPTSH